MSRLMLQALRAEKSKQQAKCVWYARGKCFDKQDEQEAKDLVLALRLVPKSEWFYFDAKLPLVESHAAPATLLGRLPTLIIDLEQTLVHSVVLEQEGYVVVSKRPGVDQFLATMSKHYELVAWVSSQEKAQAAALDQVLGKVFSHRLYELEWSELGRSLDRVLVLTASERRECSGCPFNVMCMPKYSADGRHEQEGQFGLVEKVLSDLASLKDVDMRHSMKLLKSQGVLDSIRSGKQQLQSYTLPRGTQGVIRLEVVEQNLNVQVSEPYLPAIEDGRRTLVLDLDETLVSTTRLSTSGAVSVHLVSKRPGVDEFLARLSKKCELVLWTASWQEYADAVVDKVLDPNRVLFSHRLYEQHLSNGRKDLSKLGRPMDKTLVVDDTDWRYSEEEKTHNLIQVPKYLAFDGHQHGEDGELQHLWSSLRARFELLVSKCARFF